MINLLIALVIAAAFAVWVGLYASWVGAVVLGLIAGAVAFFLLSRRTAAKLSDRVAEVERHVRAGRTEQAVSALEDLRAYSRWQFRLDRSIDAQIGTLLYAQQEFSRARPYLERAPRRAWHARAMLAADHFRHKRHAEMRRELDAALKRNKKVGFLYATYAWCEWKRGRANRAIQILGDGVRRLPKDEKLRKNLLALQNRKKMRMRAYGPEWWALHLERPPRAQARGMPGPPGMRRAFR